MKLCILFNFTGQKFLVIGGGGHSNAIEIIDVKNPNYGSSCQLPDYPIDKMEYGAGGIINDKKAIVCGGYNWINFERNKECFILGPEKTWTKIQSLKRPRSHMSTGNIVINSKLWISGGSDVTTYLESTDSTELVSEDQTLDSIDMPLTVSSHCSVFVERTRIMTIGGYDNIKTKRNETHVMDTTTNIWTPGPELNNARHFHGCAKVTIGDKDVVVVTGGLGALNSVEYLELTDMDQGWKSGNFTSLINF